MKPAVAVHADEAVISDVQLRHDDVAGPRYTSYPTSDRFVEAFNADDYAQSSAQRRGGASAMVLPFLLDVHIFSKTWSPSPS